MQLHVVANEFATALGADGKDLLAIAAGNCSGIGEGAGGELNGFCRAAEEPGLHRKQPNIGTLARRGSVNKILAVGVQVAQQGSGSRPVFNLVGTALPSAAPSYRA